MFPVEKEVRAGSQLTDSVLQCEHKFEKKKQKKKRLQLDFGSICRIKGVEEADCVLILCSEDAPGKQEALLPPPARCVHS